MPSSDATHAHSRNLICKISVYTDRVVNSRADRLDETREPAGARAVLHRLDQQQKRLQLADVRVGRTAVGRLRWLIRFIQSDPALLRGKALEGAADDLMAFSTALARHRLGPSGRITSRQLIDIRQTLRTGVRAFLRPGGGWTIPLKGLERVMRRRPNGTALTIYRTERLIPDALARIVMLAAADLLEREGGRIRQCAERGCGALFVKVKRKEFCGPQCAHRARMRRYLAKPAKRDRFNKLRKRRYKAARLAETVA